MTSNRRPLVLVVTGLALLLVAGGLWWFTSAPKGEAVPWYLTGMGGANSSLADSQVNDPLIVRVHVNQWPVDVNDDSWLTQSVDYGSDVVTITLRVSPDYPLHKNGYATVGWYDTGGWVNVHLREQLPIPVRLRDGATGAEFDYFNVETRPS